MNKGFKRALTGLLFAAAFPFWVVDGSASGKISISMAGGHPNPVEIQPAMGRLLTTCRGIIAHSSDIEWIEARTDEAKSTSVEGDYGWKQWVSFEVKVKTVRMRFPLSGMPTGKLCSSLSGPTASMSEPHWQDAFVMRGRKPV
jgi:hypothetical protein